VGRFWSDNFPVWGRFWSKNDHFVIGRYTPELTPGMVQDIIFGFTVTIKEFVGQKLSFKRVGQILE
jgi:hypothetical protein|tara:strand:- start:400 stop:597 length:198 start_codon:yes stop_codon:yes gene_type:complete